jgi:anti-anti-sigma factor
MSAALYTLNSDRTAAGEVLARLSGEVDRSNASEVFVSCVPTPGRGGCCSTSAVCSTSTAPAWRFVVAATFRNSESGDARMVSRVNLSNYPPLEIRQSRDPDGAARLSLIGELDLVGTRHFQRALAPLRGGGAAIRLDVSLLTFVDSSGLRALLSAVVDAGRDGFELSIDPSVSSEVRRLVELVGIGDILWPAGLATKRAL